MNLKECPICGHTPRLRTVPLFDEDYPGHGYEGCYFYNYECSGCERIESESADSVRLSEEEARAEAVKRWNKEVKDVLKWMKKKEVK